MDFTLPESVFFTPSGLNLTADTQIVFTPAGINLTAVTQIAFTNQLDITYLIVKKLNLKSIIQLSAVNHFFNDFIHNLVITKQLKNSISLIPLYRKKIKSNSLTEIILIIASHVGYLNLVKFLIKNENLSFHYALRINLETNHYNIKDYLKRETKDPVLKQAINFNDQELLKFILEEKNFINDGRIYSTYLFDILFCEQYFHGISGFGKKSLCEISRHGDIAEEFYLKIVLPDLPKCITWKKENFIYKLINQIEIEIGGYNIVTYSSTKLKNIDKLNGSMEKIKLLSKLKNNVVYYPINLKDIFNEKYNCTDDICSICQYDKKFSLKNHGIDLSHLYYQQVRFYVRFGNILDMVDYNSVNNISDVPPELNELNNLDLVDASLLVRYIIYDFKNTGQKCNLKQNINSWLDKIVLSPYPNKYIELVLTNNRWITQINRLVLFYKTKNHTNITFCNLKLFHGNHEKPTIIKKLLDHKSNIICFDLIFNINSNSKIFIKFKSDSTNIVINNRFQIKCFVNVSNNIYIYNGPCRWAV